MARTYQSDYKHAYKTSNYNLDYRPGESDLQYYKRLAKVADQRMVRLEKLAGIYEDPKTKQILPGVEGFEKATKYAYDKALRDLELYGGGKRFNTKPPLNPDGTVDNRLLSEKLADMRSFLSSVTSTKQGIVSVYTERAKTFNAQFGTNYTWQDLADFYQSGDADKALQAASSATVQKAIGKIQHAKERMLKEMNKNAKVTLAKDDKIVYSKAMDLLKSDKLNLSVLKGLTSEQKNRMAEILTEMEKEK